MRIVKNTEYLADSVTNKAQTELNQFDLIRLIDNQVEFIKNNNLIDPNISNDTTSLLESEFTLEANISNLSRASIAYGLYKDSYKYSGKTQRWEGYVTEISGNSFTSRLDDISNDGTHEIAEFSFDDVSPDDLPLLHLGSLFYFSVGYTTTSGTREKSYLLRFKRIADWTESEYDKAIDEASQLNKSLKWD